MYRNSDFDIILLANKLCAGDIHARIPSAVGQRQKYALGSRFNEVR